MEVSYRVKYIEEVVRKHIPSLSSPVKKIVKKVIEAKLIDDPIKYGKPLRYSLKGYRSLRVGDHRVVYRIEKRTIIIIAIKHRKEVYDL